MTGNVSRRDVVVVFLILCCFAGCARRSEEGAPHKSQKNPRLQILASRQHDTRIVLAAEKENEAIVRLDGDVVARWVHLGVEDLADDKDVVVQEGKDKKKRLLVLVGNNDLSVKHFAHMDAVTNEHNDPTVRVYLTDEGSRRCRDLTYDNIGRRVGVIIDGKLRGQGKIVGVNPGPISLPGKYSAKEVDAIIKAFGR